MPATARWRRLISEPSSVAAGLLIDRETSRSNTVGILSKTVAFKTAKLHALSVKIMQQIKQKH